MKIYLCGPMTGIPQHNIPAFDAAAEDLRALGHQVVSPAELDAPETRALAEASETGDPADIPETHGELLARDLLIVADEVDAVAVLPGWRESRGARLEAFAACTYGKPVLFAGSLNPVPCLILAAAFRRAAYDGILEP